jgi:hypothetical protein
MNFNNTKFGSGLKKLFCAFNCAILHTLVHLSALIFKNNEIGVRSVAVKITA